MFQMLYADDKGRIYDHPKLKAAGRTGGLFTDIEPEETIPLPAGASLVLIPGGAPVGLNRAGGFALEERDGKGRPVSAVGTLLPQGYTRTLLPAYRREERSALPLFGYAAVGFKDNQIYVAAAATDDPDKWDPRHYCTPDLAGLVEAAGASFPGNRIISQLSKCALDYQCFTAQNIFYQRWEGGIPVSPACNARCLGCISLQPAECCPSPQNRIEFRPSIEEVSEIAVPHLDKGPEAIISFGQGCEGEPSLASDTIAGAVAAIRRETARGTVNMNTNAGYTKGIEEICRAGIDSLRVSTISARESTYQGYYCPQNYSWQDVMASVKIARSHGVFVSLNLLTMPGITDRADEVDTLLDFIREYDVNMVQIRNLNIDPDFLAAKMPAAFGTESDILGINEFIKILREEAPGLMIGNYSKPV